MRDRRRPSELKTKSGHVRQCLHVANWVPEIASTETLRYVRRIKPLWRRASASLVQQRGSVMHKEYRLMESESGSMTVIWRLVTEIEGRRLPCARISVVARSEYQVSGSGSANKGVYNAVILEEPQ